MAQEEQFTMTAMPLVGNHASPHNHYYFNGFQIGLTNSDVAGTLLLNNSPVASISMSYTTAKTLCQALNEVVEALQRVTKHDIMTVKDVASGLEALAQEKAAERL